MWPPSFGGGGEGGKEQREDRGEFGKCAHLSSGSQLGERIARPDPSSCRPLHTHVEALGGEGMQKRKRRSPAAEARSRQRLLQWEEKRDRHRLQSELRTTPIRSIETTKTRLIKRLEIQAEDLEDSGAEGDGVVEKTVFASTKTKTILLPQSLKSPKSSFVSVTSSPPRTSCSGRRLDVPTASTPWSPT